MIARYRQHQCLHACLAGWRSALQVKAMLAPFGSLKSFNLVMDKTTGKSKVRFVFLAHSFNSQSCSFKSCPVMPR